MIIKRSPNIVDIRASLLVLYLLISALTLPFFKNHTAYLGFYLLTKYEAEQSNLK